MKASMRLLIATYVAAQVLDVTFTTYLLQHGWQEMNPLPHLIGWPVFVCLKLVVTAGVPWLCTHVDERTGLFCMRIVTAISILPMLLIVWGM